MIFKPLAIVVLSATICVPLARAQRGGVAFAASPHFGIQSSARFTGFHRAGNFSRRSASLLVGDPFLLDYGDGQPYAVESTAPQVFIVPSPVTAPQPAPPPIDPLIIEWRGDRYVRVANSSNATALDYVAPSATVTKPVAPRENVPALLIFRDGSRVEVSSYTIVGNSLYAAADRWIVGVWSKKIDLASLDVPSTLRANQERGVPFALPSSPNEVIVRP